MYSYQHIPVAPIELNEFKLLKLTKVDDRFPPGKENLDIEYKIHGLDDKVRAAEKAHGAHTVNWDGKANCPAGDLDSQGSVEAGEDGKSKLAVVSTGVRHFRAE